MPHTHAHHALTHALAARSGVLVPVFLLHCLLTKRVEGLLVFLAYHALRRVRTARTWPSLRQLFCLDGTQYWRSQRVVLDHAGFKDGLVPHDGGRMLAFHPHGMLCCGWTLCNASARFSAVTWLVADVLLAVPFISDFLRWHASEPVGAASLRRALAARRTVALLPGGFEEATLYRYGRHRVFLKRRAGFVKFALQHGYALHPVYCFGEELTFRSFTPLEALRLRLCAWKVPAVLFWGLPLAPFMPRRDVDLTVVVGPPLQLPRLEAPSAEQVAHWHAQYCAALTALFDAHKAQYAAQGADAVLELL